MVMLPDATMGSCAPTDCEIAAYWSPGKRTPRSTKIHPITGSTKKKERGTFVKYADKTHGRGTTRTKFQRRQFKTLQGRAWTCCWPRTEKSRSSFVAISWLV